MEFIIISGLSGAGKSSAAAFLEDLGFYCVDNLPVALITSFAGICMAGAGTGRYSRVALVTDIRGGQTFDELFQALDELKEMKLDYQLLFVEASDEVIINRYKETRHTHPLTRQGYSLPEAVQLERMALEPVRRRASHILNSTGLNLSKFRGELLRLFGMGSLNEAITVSVTSFGFKYGIPIDADLVFDVRFLPNPYYIAELKECTGLEEAVRTFLFGYRQTHEFLRHLEELFSFLLPQYVEEGKSSLVIAIGCTGGHHRSVAIAHALTEFIRQKGYRVEEQHRDMGR
ncbi:MAG: RNase adapter RapZ [Clostridiales bacterium]|uniref:RNase adapter RapZ n=1 Tax=Evtepia sp. TaxID=2773933 RepID=UPI0029856990|nr:RNase adapter RapZ [Evtepia sp.]MDD7289567.1 RNase adapter RapZ [Clostridiales bacterium]MDY3993932.1 RNase adapter RapZ [Evtepia sp.]MDY4429611.1 RNase adapter RapZ [Evtepia sp.]